MLAHERRRSSEMSGTPGGSLLCQYGSPLAAVEQPQVANTRDARRLWHAPSSAIATSRGIEREDTRAPTSIGPPVVGRTDRDCQYGNRSARLTWKAAAGQTDAM